MIATDAPASAAASAARWPARPAPMMRTSCAGMLRRSLCTRGVRRRLAAGRGQGAGGVRPAQSWCVCGVPLSRVRWHARGVCGFKRKHASQMQHTPRYRAGGSLARTAVGGRCRCAQAAGVGARGARGAAACTRAVPCAGSTAASTPSAARFSPRGALACGGPRLRRGRGTQSRQRRGALEPLRATTRRRAGGDRPRVPAAGPGDPPAPFSFPRCPGHHPPPRHPSHDGAPHAAGPRRRRPGPPPRASAGASRAPRSSTTRAPSKR